MTIPFPAPTTSRTWSDLSDDARQMARNFRREGNDNGALQAHKDMKLFDLRAAEARVREARLLAQVQWRRKVEPAVARGCQAVLDLAARKP